LKHSSKCRPAVAGCSILIAVRTFAANKGFLTSSKTLIKNRIGFYALFTGL